MLLEECGPLPSQVAAESLISHGAVVEPDTITQFILNRRREKFLSKFPSYTLSNPSNDSATVNSAFKLPVTTISTCNQPAPPPTAPPATALSVTVHHHRARSPLVFDLNRPPPGQDTLPPSMRLCDLDSLLAEPIETWG